MGRPRVSHLQRGITCVLLLTQFSNQLILLVRHGESESNRDKSVNCHTPNHCIPLTSIGKQQALLAGHKLVTNILREDDSIMFYTSPYERARQTLKGIIEGGNLDEQKINYKVCEEPRMREQDFGNFQGNNSDMEKIWKERAHYGHFFYRIPFGESGADCFDRVASFNETLFRQFSDDDFPSILVLVSHGVWMRVFLMKWFRWSVEKFESLRNLPHCQFIVMEKNLETERYLLKSHLRTWDDLDENEIGDEVEKEYVDELHFNSYQTKLDPERVNEIINAEKEAIASQKEKDRSIKAQYDKSHT